MAPKIIIAPDSFKGSLSALEVANSMARGIKKRWTNAALTIVPMADGGEGTTLALVHATKGKLQFRSVTDPLGQRVEACFGILGDGKTGVIEVAQASGLSLVPLEKRNPLKTNSFGTGELIREALQYGCKQLIIGLGGSATNDGAMGLLTALGVVFLDAQGKQMIGCGGDLHKIEKIDVSNLDHRLFKIPIKVACDVSNPLCGVNGASAVYGSQKGATSAMVTELDHGLEHYSNKIEEFLGVKIASMPGVGAAGGIGAGLVSFLKAQLVSGVNLIIDVTDLETMVKDADLVITGEGQTDQQTICGKTPIGVAKIAKKYGKPVICISGNLGYGSELVLEEGIDALFSICSGPITLEEAMAKADRLICFAAYQVASLWQAALTCRS